MQQNTKKITEGRNFQKKIYKKELIKNAKKLNPKKRITKLIRISDSNHTKLKLRAVELGVTISKLADKLLKDL